MESEKLMEAAMSVIVEAGDGRDLIKQAFEKIAEIDFDAANERIASAKQKLKAAHNAQTDVIQDEMSVDEERSAVFLFNHAQDTLMTINSEFNIASYVMGIVQPLVKRIEALEKQIEDAS